ncbi:MAG TPA: hypothetical protein VG826_22230 [Pirellulales bacterium]|nr:hypothetical protein [Pirellulales bacterium]
MTWKPSRSAAVILSTVLGLLIAYPLSIGPAIMLLGALGVGEYPFLENAFYCVYDRPLGLLTLPDPLSDLLDWWIQLWDIYGIVPA